MYKILALDMDDTLLRKDLTISEKNKDAIKKAAEKGVKIVFCSGRSSKSMINYINNLNGYNCNEYLISYNGAMVLNLKDKATLFNKYVEKEYVLKLVDYGRTNNLNIQLYIDDNVVVEKFDERTKQYEVLSGLPVKQVKDLKEVSDKGSLKVLINNDENILNELKTELDELLGNDLNIFFSKPYYLEFLNKKANKGIGLLELAKLIDIPLKDIIAIGDSFNDISMIEIAGLGVAIGNAHEKVKKIANYVTKNDHNNDGVAEVIEKFILD
ncbi:hypothetical protein EDC18_11231 [Natranaerovirga pectinivora]|uniref:Cof subfamily protein (Haloacid dehalogenase superfamily)/HAD superfamily hydrolase (TIGR01484 family) n=1 Tax=Natranaerovirga pectinivora TaxID=682400 RepID=A0A4R3MGL3_9FIRM|nr:Cof-type HAD-IIB family hydrolase [Natranaerovirga pectinivora]TCT12260.1 hypothetical protein EDC18_11231 [Natranaerovirga pectinivora]